MNQDLLGAMCLIAETKVLLENGTQLPVRLIKQGMALAGSNGQTNLVERVISRMYQGEIYGVNDDCPFLHLNIPLKLTMVGSRSIPIWGGNFIRI